MDSPEIIDEYGINLLRELQRNARASIADLGRRIGLSASATAERLRRLEEHADEPATRVLAADLRRVLRS